MLRKLEEWKAKRETSFQALEKETAETIRETKSILKESKKAKEENELRGIANAMLKAEKSVKGMEDVKK